MAADWFSSLFLSSLFVFLTLSGFSVSNSKVSNDKCRFHALKRWGEDVRERRYVLLLLNQSVPCETGFVVTLTVTWLCPSRPSKPLIRPEVLARGLIVTFYLFREYDDYDWNWKLFDLSSLNPKVYRKRNWSGLSILKLSIIIMC